MDCIANSVIKDRRFQAYLALGGPSGYSQSLKMRVTLNTFVMLVYFDVVSSGFALFSKF